VRVVTNRIVCGVEYDIVLLFQSQLIPFAVIEVKKPGYLEHFAKIIFSSKGAEGVKDAGMVAGQNSDQLGALEECMGYRSLFGMISNGNNWMIIGCGSREFALQEQDSWAQLRSDPMETGNSPEQDGINVEHFEKTFRLQVLDTSSTMTCSGQHLGFWNEELCLCVLGSISQVTEKGGTLWIDGALSNLRDRVKGQSSTPVADGSTPMHVNGLNLQNNTVHSGKSRFGGLQALDSGAFFYVWT
jgi:hypothetical protein